MRRHRLLLGIMLAVFYLPMAMAERSIEGIWITVDDKTGDKRAIVRLVIQDEVLRGHIEQIYTKEGDTGVCSQCPEPFKDKPIQGLQFLWGLTEKKLGTWEGGEILDAKSGKIYRAKLTVKGDKLYVRGYVGIPMLGRTQVWVRA